MDSETSNVRVLHVVPAFHPATYYGGPLVSVYALCQAEAELGCDVQVVTTDADGPGRAIPIPPGGRRTYPPGVRVHYSHGLRECVAPQLLFEVWRSIRDVDVVHLTSIYNFPVIPTLLFCRLRGIPVVWSPRGALNAWHGEPRKFLKAVFRKICSWVAPRTTVLHVTSAQEAAFASTRFPTIPTVVVPNGVAIPAAISRTAPSARLRITYLGRIHRVKGIELLIAACASLTGIPFELTIAGHGEPAYVDELRALIHSSQISNYVTFTGFVDGPDARARLFARTDLFVLPSYSENFGMVVAEALAHAVPVVTTTRTPWQALAEMRCGVSVEPTVEALAEGIGWAASQSLREMGDRGREWMQASFQWQSVAAELIRAYQRLAQANVPRRVELTSPRKRVSRAGGSVPGA